MIIENNIPSDDSQNSETEDQQSQKDIHSNGFSDKANAEEETEQPNTDALQQAYKAAEASYTLETEKGIETDEKDNTNSNVKS
jgi:hypothetical protein